MAPRLFSLFEDFTAGELEIASIIKIKQSAENRVIKNKRPNLDLLTPIFKIIDSTYFTTVENDQNSNNFFVAKNFFKRVRTLS